MTAAIVLAAGRATRFGGDKLLAPIDGRPMLQHVLDLCAAANLAPVVVVLGQSADDLVRACTWRNEIRVVNAHAERGISSSLQKGIAALLDNPAPRALVLLGDQPALSLAQLAGILAAPPRPDQPIVVPRYGGRPGNPVLLERNSWHLGDELSGDRGMSQVFTRWPELVRYVDVPGDNPDIDTAADLAAISRA